MGTRNAIVIGAGTESIHAIVQAKQLGLYVVALDGNPSAPGLGHAEKGFVIDINDYELVCKMIEPFAPTVVIPAPIGRCLTTVGAVNDYFNLKGVARKTAELCTDKHLFHMALARQHMRQVTHILVPTGESNLNALLSGMEYPVVVKPRYGSGSRAVCTFFNEDDLKSYFAHPLEEDFVVEGCVKGTEYGVDAAYINGQLHLILLREKLLTAFPFRQCVGYFSVERDSFGMEEHLGKACGVLGFNNCLLHADIIADASDVFIIEMSARPSGHNLHNLFTPMVTGVDMVSEFLKFALPEIGQSYSFKPRYNKCMLIKYFSFLEGVLDYVPNADDVCRHFPVEAYQCNLKKGMELGKVMDGTSLMNRGYYVLSGTDKDELEKCSVEIERLFLIEGAGILNG